MSTPVKKYDPTLPQNLKQVQHWFASIITRPIDPQNKMIPTSPSGVPMHIEATQFICPSPTMHPHERIEIYNQQYWWRLLTIMQDNHPFLLRLFGYSEFNRIISIPYLVKYYPNHWSLNALGARLPQWVRQDYHADDKALVLDAARIDCAFMHSFVAEQRPLPRLSREATASDREQLLEQTLRHQPHLLLFSLRRNLFRFRDAMLEQEDGDYWLNHDFPALPKEQIYAVLYRTMTGYDLVWKLLSEAAYRYLSLFKKGCSVNQSLKWLETQDSPLADEVVNNLQTWLQEWIALGWFS